MSSQVSKVHTAYVLCVLFDTQLTLSAFRDNKVRNWGKEILFLFFVAQTHLRSYPRKLDIIKIWLICDKHHYGPTNETPNLSWD